MLSKDCFFAGNEVDLISNMRFDGRDAYDVFRCLNRRAQDEATNCKTMLYIVFLVN